MECGTEPCSGCLPWPGRNHRRAECPIVGDEECFWAREQAHYCDDHRLCDPDWCQVAERWHATVIDVGVTACLAAQRGYTVVSVRSGAPEVVGHADTSAAAKQLRTRRGRRGRSNEERFAAKADHYVVCANGHLH